jgi:phospholipid/cholesterol/gamma-HCH transport system ATP-binding protein
MIEVNNLHKGFAEVKVLKGISTTFHPGKTSLIIGQSGSGKTVFLKSLIGLHIPEEGTISFDGRINTQFTNEEKRQCVKKLEWFSKEVHCSIHKQSKRM